MKENPVYGKVFLLKKDSYLMCINIHQLSYPNTYT